MILSKLSALREEYSGRPHPAISPLKPVTAEAASRETRDGVLECVEQSADALQPFPRFCVCGSGEHWSALGTHGQLYPWKCSGR